MADAGVFKDAEGLEPLFPGARLGNPPLLDKAFTPGVDVALPNSGKVSRERGTHSPRGASPIMA